MVSLALGIDDGCEGVGDGGPLSACRSSSLVSSSSSKSKSGATCRMGCMNEKKITYGCEKQVRLTWKIDKGFKEA